MKLRYIFLQTCPINRVYALILILDDLQVKKFIELANNFGLDCLIEVHDEDELNRALKIDYPMIGINNRNLKNLSVDINNTINLIKKIPKDFVIVAESGIKNKKDIETYNNLGIFNFLIGESILKSKNIYYKIKELIK